MKTINRRHFLGSLAVSTVYANAAGANTFQQPKPVIVKQENHQNGTWFVARQDREAGGEHGIDFWSKPLCKIAYADQLPPEITRSYLWYDEANFDSKADRADANVSSVLDQHRSAWLNDESILVKPCNRIESPSTQLLNLINQRAGHRGETALLALDSECESKGDPDWADILPAFRRCYDRVIGHFHLERRGFHHWKTWLSNGPFDNSYFEQFFSKSVSQCDAIVLTSQSLAENDSFLPARASTETLVGEMMRRFGHALLDANVLEHIAPIGTLDTAREGQPKIFALGSAGSSVSFPEVQLRDLCRQRELVLGSFGKQILPPLFIATCADDISAEMIQKQVSGSNIQFLKTRTNTSRGCDGAPLEWLELIALWPFDPDCGPWS